MKKDWEAKTLGEISNFVRGPFGGSLKKNIFVEDGYAVYEQAHAIYGDFEKFRYFIDQKKFDEMRRFLVKSGDLLMSCSGTMGKTSIVPENTREGIINQALLKISPNKNLDITFLKLWMDSDFFQDQLSVNAGGAAIKNVASVKILKDLKIELPDYKGQKRIVKILDEKFEVIEKLKKVAEEQLASAKELFESRSEELLTNSEKWEEKTIGDVCVLENGDRGKNYPSNAKLQTEGIPFVSAGNLQEQSIELKGRNYLTDKQYSLLRSGKFTNGDILFCLRGSLGKYAFVESVDKGAIASSLVIVRPREFVSKEYIMSYFGSGLCKKMVEKYAGGAAQPNLGAKDLKKFVIYLPTLQEQKLICDELSILKEQTKELETIFQKKITDLEELKKSYLHEAFSGNL